MRIHFLSAGCIDLVPKTNNNSAMAITVIKEGGQRNVSFSVKWNKKKKIKRTLQVPGNVKQNRLQKRMRFFVPGTLTVEAACVLPLFLMVMTGLTYIGQLLYLETRIQLAMEQIGGEMAAYYYAVEALDGDEEAPGLGPVIGELAQGTISAAYAKGQIQKLAGEEILDQSFIRGGKDGLSLLGSSFFHEEDTLDLVVSYQYELPFLGFLNPITVTQRSVHRAWTGKQATESQEEAVVYITETGTVYHKSLQCTYLKQSVMEADPQRIEEYRNESGSRYTPCERCSPNEGKGTTGYLCYYITKYGTKYHYTLACPALTRGIRSVRLSEVGGRPPCSKCGEGE